MSDFGIQTYVEGTSFDATLSVSDNYILDFFVFNSANGSKTYSLPDSLKLSIKIVDIYYRPTSLQIAVNQQTKTITWSGANIGASGLCVEVSNV